MAIYTVHVPDDTSDRVTQADRTVFLREGFSSWAFLLGVIYLLWHRLWVAAAIWILAATALLALAVVLHPPSFFLAALSALMHLYLGVEAHDFRRWRLARRGFSMADLVSAYNIDEAEIVFFGRHQGRPSQSRTVQRWAAMPSTPAVIGMFPDASGP